ncbi:hypothetical protein CACET_c33240 [Clostridium aceticum]|uniref:Uncharacterized protein n=1 Tax=Clostridium aceticum TaxID=84022 RepID=A0A0D8IC35_9CLOT|nr:hypothetical protein [Clostridium aceticum]AKL96768.1 hypothetical protein CACET_c33240 [Clostridium aceticum]KJF27527.1 hypothetical protein TZ02_06975 [Clostridium aceticum]
MTKKNSIRKFYLLLLILSILIMSLSACNINPQRPQQKEGQNKPPEVPTVLDEMYTQILTLMYDIDSIEGIQVAISEKEAQEPPSDGEAQIQLETEGGLETEAKIEQPPGSDEVGGEDITRFIEKTTVLIPLLEEEDIEGATAEIEGPPEEIEEIWFQINDQVQNLHRKWNVLEADLRDVNAPQDQIEAFEHTLTTASLEVMEEKAIESLLSLNELTMYLADFRNAFTSKVPGQVFKIRYHIRHSLLHASIDEYGQAQEHIDKVKEIKNGLQAELLEKGAAQDLQKFDLSIEDLENQIKLQNFNLVRTDGAIVLKNTALMEDTYKSHVEE